MRGKVIINEERCKECGLCVSVCPQNVLRISNKLNSKGYHPVEAFQPEKCTGCTFCGLMCPDSVLTIKRKSPERK